MIYESDLSGLMGTWLSRSEQSRPTDFSYSEAINECINDLNALITKQHEEEFIKAETEQKTMDDYFNNMTDEEFKEWLDEYEADSYLMFNPNEEIA